jgi:hypothetical protein
MDQLPSGIPLVHCKNCQHEVSLKFCPNCGQSADTPRITGKLMWREILRVYLILDKGLIFTVKSMLLHPGLTPLSYIEGKRVRFMKPLTFIAIGSALCKAAVQKYSNDFSPQFDIKEVPEALLSMILVGTILVKMGIKNKTYNFWEVVTLQVFTHFVFIILVAISTFIIPTTILPAFLICLPPIYAMYNAVAYWEFFDLKTPNDMIKATLVAAAQTMLLINQVQ